MNINDSLFQHRPVHLSYFLYAILYLRMFSYFLLLLCAKRILILFFLKFYMLFCIYALHRYCRRLMALPFLPADSTSAAFSAIKDRARAPKLQTLVGYVDRTWITSKLWPPRAWSAYRYGPTMMLSPGTHDSTGKRCLLTCLSTS